MMLYFSVFYLLAIASGLLLMGGFIVHCRRAIAFKETLAIFIALFIFLVMGLAIIYAAANSANSTTMDTLFSSVSAVILGGLSYLLPRYHHVRFGLAFMRRHQLVFGMLALASVVAGAVIWLMPEAHRLWWMSLPLAAVFVAVIHCHIVYSKQTRQQHIPPQLMIKAAIMPILAFFVSLLEGFLYPELTVIYGVTASLPFIFIAANLTIWLFRDILCPPGGTEQ